MTKHKRNDVITDGTRTVRHATPLDIHRMPRHLPNPVGYQYTGHGLIHIPTLDDPIDDIMEDNDGISE